MHLRRVKNYGDVTRVLNALTTSPLLARRARSASTLSTSNSSTIKVMDSSESFSLGMSEDSVFAASVETSASPARAARASSALAESAEFFSSTKSVTVSSDAAVAAFILKTCHFRKGLWLWNVSLLPGESGKKVGEWCRACVKCVDYSSSPLAQQSLVVVTE